ncbi:MAG: MFS transporter [Chloroflexota bacterium]|nr:MFS transporter [Chloroflexota bacterium]
MTTIEALPDIANARVAGTADPQRWKAYFVLLLAGFMDLLDTTVVNIGFPSIQRDLGASTAAVQWVVAGYIVAFGLVLITGGRLGDLYGRRRMFLLGVGGFTLTSALAGLAPTPWTLIAARVLQGIAAAIMVPQILAIVQTIFPPGERPAAFGVYGAVTGLAAVAGPLVGGLLVQHNLLGLEWRPIFLVNIPIGLVALVLTARVVPESKEIHARRLDLRGVGLLTVSLLLVLYPLVQGHEMGWRWWMSAMMVASIPAFAWFVHHERELTRAGASPLVPLDLFRERAFAGGLLTSLVFFGGTGAFFLTLAVTLQLGLGFSPLRAGLAVIPFSIAAAIGSAISVPAAPRVGRLVLQAGVATFIVGLGLLAATMHDAGAAVSLRSLVLPLATTGLGMGLVVAPLVDVILAGVHGRDAGAASGVLNATGQLGQAIGIAAIGALYFAVLGRATPAAYAQALERTLWGEIAIFAACIGVMFLLPRHGVAAGEESSQSHDDVRSGDRMNAIIVRRYSEGDR